MPNLHSVGEMIQRDPSNVWNLRTKSTSRRSFGNHLISFWAMCLYCRTMVTMAYHFTQMLKPSHLYAGNHNLTHAYLVKHFFNLQICQSRILFTASDPRPSGTPYQREGISAKM
jgi:hypothetical protein